jgi:hypothetical protein
MPVEVMVCGRRLDSGWLGVRTIREIALALAFYRVEAIWIPHAWESVLHDDIRRHCAILHVRAVMTRQKVLLPKPVELLKVSFYPRKPPTL